MQYWIQNSNHFHSPGGTLSHPGPPPLQASPPIHSRWGDIQNSTTFWNFNSASEFWPSHSCDVFPPVCPQHMLLQVDSALDLSHTQNIGQMLKDHFQVHISIAIMPIIILTLLFPASTRSSLWSASRMACSTMPMSYSGKQLHQVSITNCKQFKSWCTTPIFTTPMFSRTKFVDGMSTVSRTSQDQNKKRKWNFHQYFNFMNITFEQLQTSTTELESEARVVSNIYERSLV